MLTNAKATTYTTPAISDGSGGRTAGTQSTLNVRCYSGGIRRAQEISLAARIATATSVVCLPMGNIPVPDKGGKIAILLDQTSAAVELEIVFVNSLPHGHQSHYELFVKETA